MVEDFGEKMMHNKESTLRKDGLNMTMLNQRLKFVNVYMFVDVYMCKRVHGPSSTLHEWVGLKVYFARSLIIFSIR